MNLVAELLKTDPSKNISQLQRGMYLGQLGTALCWKVVIEMLVAIFVSVFW